MEQPFQEVTVTRKHAAIVREGVELLSVTRGKRKRDHWRISTPCNSIMCPSGVVRTLALEMLDECYGYQLGDTESMRLVVIKHSDELYTVLTAQDTLYINRDAMKEFAQAITCIR